MQSTLEKLQGERLQMQLLSCDRSEHKEQFD